ncbi:helix-turn-helix transcriptional regulator [Marinobacter salarius]|uniref:helix-turn-helix transcriptional regulator n=1 Tax=Marinobacter salarius TaxID=1420917 RepID=UPI003212D87E
MLTTEQLAEKLHVKPNTIRSSLCRTGSYMGIRPVKLPNRFLAWPADAVDQLLAQSQNTTESQQA